MCSALHGKKDFFCGNLNIKTFFGKMTKFNCPISRKAASQYSTIILQWPYNWLTKIIFFTLVYVAIFMNLRALLFLFEYIACQKNDTLQLGLTQKCQCFVCLLNIY